MPVADKGRPRILPTPACIVKNARHPHRRSVDTREVILQPVDKLRVIRADAGRGAHETDELAVGILPIGVADAAQVGSVDRRIKILQKRQRIRRRRRHAGIVPDQVVPLVHAVLVEPAVVGDRDQHGLSRARRDRRQEQRRRENSPLHLRQFRRAVNSPAHCAQNG